MTKGHDFKIKTEGRARIFKNPILEALTRTSPYVIWGIYLPLNAYLLYLGATKYHIPIGYMIGIFIFAMFFWTFAEYMLHRFLFHMEFYSKNKTFHRISYIMHGVHHEYPHDKERLFMPPVPSLIIASILFSLFYLIMGKYVFAFFPGFVFGYLLYATTHYLTHAVKNPPKPFRKLWQHHLIHHYKYPDKAFGVSNRFWDAVFGTLPPEK